MNQKTVLVTFKTVIALLGFSAIVTEIATLVERQSLNIVNFFSYFTVENNIIFAFTILLSAFATASGKSSRFLDSLRGFSTVFMVVVGIGFAILLSGIEGIPLTAVPWDNTVLHYIIPVAAVVDYLIDRPKHRLYFSRSFLWMIYPVAYIIYALVRGQLTGWYPYPFLNPANDGWMSVGITIGGLFVLSVALIWLVSLLSGSRR